MESNGYTQKNKKDQRIAEMLFEYRVEYKKKGAEKIEIREKINPYRYRNGEPVAQDAKGPEGKYEILPEYEGILEGQAKGDIVRNIQALGRQLVKERREEQEKEEGDKEIRSILAHKTRTDL